jgi:DNA-binding transcriptional regulator YdaS (Cro superfamily)
MKLIDYLNAHDIGFAEFARRIGGVSRMTVQRYANGARMPRPDAMVRIIAATDGAVTPNDFFPYSPTKDAEAA